MLTDVQQAMVEAGGVQCGFCTPGFVVAIHDLLDRVPEPDPLEVREALAGNLCRCTGYGRILAAVEQVVAVRTAAAIATRRSPTGGDAVTDVQTPPSDAGRTGRRARRRQPGPPRRHAQGAGPLRLLLRPARRRDAVGPHAAVAAPPRPHPSRSTSGPALAIPGVACVVTADDVPGAATYGLISADQPVFAADVVRFVGEPVAAVAADHPDTARRALEAIVVAYELLPPLVDADAAPTAPPIHPDGNVIRRVTIAPRRRRGQADGDVVVEGTYEVGMQDQAFLGPESGLAVPDGEGGVDLWVATQWLHEDRDQVAACLGLAHRRRAAAPRRRRRRLRRARGREHAGARLPAGAAHRAAGEDELPARRVVPRPRPPAPGPHALPPPRHPRRRAW